MTASERPPSTRPAVASDVATSTLARPALCYVVSHYTSRGHAVHLPRLFEELSKYADVHVALWNHDSVPNLPGVASVTLLASGRKNRILRMAAMVGLAWRLRRSGCRVFFVRIQDTIAIVLSMLRVVLGIEVYLWRSGLHQFTWPVTRSRRGNLVRWMAWQFRWKVVFPLAGRVVTRFVTGPASMMAYYEDRYRIPRRRQLLLSNDVDVEKLMSISRDRPKAECRRRLGLDETAEVLTYVGRVAPLNLGDGEAILQVADQVLGTRPRAHLMLVGQIDFPGFRDRVERFAWSDRVHFTGRLPFRDVVDQYLAADIFIFPVIAAGFPRVLLEAMALGVPFVTTDVGGARDLAAPEQESCVVSWFDTPAFIRMVETLLDDPTLRADLVKVGQRRVRTFSTQAVAADFMDKIVRPSYGL